MGAKKAPKIISVIREESHGIIVTLIESGRLNESREWLKWCDRSTLMAVGRVLNAFHGKGTPVGMTVEEMIIHITASVDGVSSPSRIAPVTNPSHNQSTYIQPSGSYDPPTTHKKPSFKEPTIVNTNQPSVQQAISDLILEAFKELEPAVSQVDPAIVDKLQQQIDAMESTIVDLQNRIQSSQPTQLVVNGVQLEPTVGVVHAKYHDVAKLVALKHNIYLVGPAGSGKSTIPEQIAKAMNMEFSAMSCGTTDAKFDFVGYRDGNGTLHGTSFRERWINGGVFLLDEMDNASPELLVTLNQALANGVCSFPDGMFTKHADFICFGAGNTFGNGATAQYVGRSPQDGATMNRFTKQIIDIDLKVEDAMLQSVSLESSQRSSWVNLIRTARLNCESKGLRVMVTPRDAKAGAEMISVGFTLREAFDARVGFGLEANQYAKVTEGCSF